MPIDVMSPTDHFLGDFRRQLSTLEHNPNADHGFDQGLIREWTAVLEALKHTRAERSFSHRSPVTPVDQAPSSAVVPQRPVQSLVEDKQVTPPPQAVQTTPDPSGITPPSGGGSPSTQAGSGPNHIDITNTTNHDMLVGEFLNGGSTTTPIAEIDLKPGQTGELSYQNGQAGFDAEADSNGVFQPTASRLEFEANAAPNAAGQIEHFDDVSDIDGRNASISVTDNQGFHIGDDKSIADGAPAGTVTVDAAGNKTIAGDYDGSTPTMQAGAAYMVSRLGTGDTYMHPNDDQLPAGQNPMRETTSDTVVAAFGDA